jgi:hypothetical protein
MKKTSNPFNNQGFSFKAWQDGYDALNSDLNPYLKEAGDLHQFWQDGRSAKLADLKPIPEGIYCYNEKGICPYWYLKERGIGGCGFIDAVDHDGSEKASLLWDQVKECGENNSDD